MRRERSLALDEERQRLDGRGDFGARIGDPGHASDGQTDLVLRLHHVSLIDLDPAVPSEPGSEPDARCHQHDRASIESMLSMEAASTYWKIGQASGSRPTRCGT